MKHRTQQRIKNVKIKEVSISSKIPGQQFIKEVSSLSKMSGVHKLAAHQNVWSEQASGLSKCLG
jgi:hypothetical protein